MNLFLLKYTNVGLENLKYMKCVIMSAHEHCYDRH